MKYQPRTCKSHPQKEKLTCLLSRKLTWNPRIDRWKTIVLDNPVVLGVHVVLCRGVMLKGFTTLPTVHRALFPFFLVMVSHKGIFCEPLRPWQVNKCAQGMYYYNEASWEQRWLVHVGIAADTPLIAAV